MEKLEIISHVPEMPTTRPPLLLVHGAWHAAWCWESNFFEWFSRQGWEVHAVSLRGHGDSDGAKRLRWFSIADYVEDIENTIDRIGRPPVLIGHSMGGFVVQAYLENHVVPGAVLLASAPPTGTLRFTYKILRAQFLSVLKAVAKLDMYELVKSPSLAKKLFLTAAIDQHSLSEYHARLQSESFRVSVVDMLFLDLPKPEKNESPIAVVGAECDFIFPPAEAKRTAEAYGTQAIVFPGLAHNMMVEPGWQGIAEWIESWVLSEARF